MQKYLAAVLTSNHRDSTSERGPFDTLTATLSAVEGWSCVSRFHGEPLVMFPRCRGEDVGDGAMRDRRGVWSGAALGFSDSSDRQNLWLWLPLHERDSNERSRLAQPRKHARGGRCDPPRRATRGLGDG